MKKFNLTGIESTRQVFLDGLEIFPERSQKLFNHSPDGFNWGYGGSGPAQLALAVLLELYDEETALNNYQHFKWEYIAVLPQDDFDVDFEIDYEEDK